MCGVLISEGHKIDMIEGVCHPLNVFGNDVSDFLFGWSCYKTHVEILSCGLRLCKIYINFFYCCNSLSINDLQTAAGPPRVTP